MSLWCVGCHPTSKDGPQFRVFDAEDEARNHAAEMEIWTDREVFLWEM